MTALRLLCDAVLSVAAGVALTELIDLPLRLVERALIALVTALVVTPAATYGLALIFGLNTATVLLGPALVLGVCAGVLIARADPLARWRRSWEESWTDWRTRRPWPVLVVTTFAVVVFSALFAHTLFTLNGDLVAGFQTVWADWSQHLTTENSFAVAGNVATANPLYAGTPLLYPFIADFQAASLVTLGLEPQVALGVPSAVLAVVVVLLIIRLARRLGLGMGAGVIAAAVTFIGGGLGFVGVFADACKSAGYSAAQCTAPHVVSNVGDGVKVAGGILHALPGVIANQPRAYDGLLTAAAQKSLPNLQWPTPLFAWWLPQRTLLFGFAAALCILVLVAVALRQQPRTWGAFVVAGVFMGILPIVHAQTLIAMAIILALVAVFHRRREWLAFAGVALLIALPRLTQIALAPHGSAAFGNVYPWFEPGWLSNAVAPAASTPGTVGALVAAIGTAIRAVFTPGWWGFWFVNLGVAVPLSVLVALMALLRHMPGRTGAVGRHLLAPFPHPVIDLAVAALAVFALCNVVIFQSWDWDNTKLFVYWYLAAGLLIGALAAHWWRQRFLRSVAAFTMVAATVLTGAVVLLRLLPWTPPVDSVGGPYTLASADERALAATIAARTPGNAVFLTYGRPNDPLLAVAGRTGLMGYYGWLWSYGTAFGNRYQDIHTMYRGCTTSAGCPVPSLLREYHVSYVEVDDRTDSPGAIEPEENTRWWASQGFPVVARSQHIVVYDVRRQ